MKNFWPCAVCCYFSSSVNSRANDFEHYCSVCKQYLFTFRYNQQVQYADKIQSRYPQDDAKDKENDQIKERLRL